MQHTRLTPIRNSPSQLYVSFDITLPDGKLQLLWRSSWQRQSPTSLCRTYCDFVVWAPFGLTLRPSCRAQTGSAAPSREPNASTLGEEVELFAIMAPVLVVADRWPPACVGMIFRVCDLGRLEGDRVRITDDTDAELDEPYLRLIND